MFDFTELEKQNAFEDIVNGIVTIPDKIGDYVVWSIKEDGKAKPIQRIFGIDQDGILFFGCTHKRTLKIRIKDEFCKSVKGGSAPHIEGKRYYNLDYARKGYPLASIRIGWRTDNNAEACEKDWLDKYEKEFGELPPLNYQGGRKK
jgi:hypothetical protein